MRAPYSLLALVALPALATGCLIATPPPPPPDEPFGDISFDWQFDGIANCNDAGVDEVDIVVLNGGEVVLEIPREPCVGGGLTITEIRTGTYEVIIDAFDRDSRLLYTGGFSVRVEGGEDNYVGVVDLDPVNAAPPPAEFGEVRLFWAFQYPTNDAAVIDCALAGVEEVDVFVEPRGDFGEAFSDTLFCDDDGIRVDNLIAGPYDLRLMAYGEYHGDDVLLYDSGFVAIDIRGDTLLDLGDVVIPRIEASFSDFDVAWSFVDDTCASTGTSTVTVSFQRLDLGEPEDAFDVDCSATNVVRRTFVPGSYSVSAFAEGATDDYLGTTTVDLPPGAVAEVTLSLAPM